MFYGWRVVGGSFAIQAFVIGFFSYSVSLLTPPVREAFGVTVEQVMYSLTMGTFVGLLAMPVAGMLLDRISARLMVAIGLALTALGLWGLSISQTITQYVVLFGTTMAIANAFTGSLLSSTVVSRWFTASRGKALGVSAIGTSVGGVVIPALITYWLNDGGWRSALQNLAIVMAAGLLPLAIWTIRSWPKDVGLEAEPAPEGAAASGPMEPLSAAQIIKDSNFWWLGIALGLLFSTYTGILSNLSPYAINAGETKEAASSLIMAIAISGLIGKLAFGIAADKIPHKMGLWMAITLVISGFMLLSIEPSYSLMLVAVVLIGLASGGMLPIWGALIADLFGLASYGRAMGLMGPLITLCVMPSFPVVGRLFDATGDFALCLWIFSGVLVLAALFLVPMRSHAQKA